MQKQLFAVLLAFNVFAVNFMCMRPSLSQYAQKTQFGTNVGPSIYFSSDALFVDVFMHASGWWTNPSTNIPLTPTGYPAAGTATTLFWIDGYPSGDYQFYGEGDFSLNPRGGNYVPGTLKKDGNVTTALIHIDVPPPSPGGYFGAENSKQCLFDVTVNDPNNPPNNLHLIPPGYPAWPNTNAEFTKEALQALAPFQCIRMMDWMGTNGSTVSTWESRANPDLWGDGNRNIAYERFIDLANATNCDLWVDIPLYATDDWSKKFATLCATRLNRNLHVYYEFSNECWNWGFSQWGQIETWAQANPSLTADGAWERHGQEVACLLMHHAKIMQPILGGMGRPILAGQMAGVSYTCGAGLDWINSTYGPPSQNIFGISGAVYFSLSSADPSPTTLDDLFVSMNDNLQSEIGTQLQQYIALAQKYQVQFCCYEGGQSLYAFGDQDLFAFYESAQYDPRMGAIYLKLANMLQASGTYLCCFYSFIGHDTRYGYWGALPDIAYFKSGGTPKYNAQAAAGNAGGLNDAHNAPPPQPGNPGSGPPGSNGIPKKVFPGKPAKGWPISPGMGKKMAMPPRTNKLILPHH